MRECVINGATNDRCKHQCHSSIHSNKMHLPLVYYLTIPYPSINAHKNALLSSSLPSSWLWRFVKDCSICMHFYKFLFKFYFAFHWKMRYYLFMPHSHKYTYSIIIRAVILIWCKQIHIALFIKFYDVVRYDTIIISTCWHDTYTKYYISQSFQIIIKIIWLNICPDHE